MHVLPQPLWGIEEMLESAAQILSAQPYLFLFLGMLVAGESVLVPAIYLAMTGRLEFAAVLAVAFAATMLSDLFWYSLGRWFPQTAMSRMSGRRATALVAGFQRLFARRGAYVLILSKFVYGTRLAAQLLAGIHDMPLRTYLLANSTGVFIITAVLAGVAASVTGAAQQFTDVAHQAEFAIVAFIVIGASGYFFVARAARREWSR